MTQMLVEGGEGVQIFEREMLRNIEKHCRGSCGRPVVRRRCLRGDVNLIKSSFNRGMETWEQIRPITLMS